MSKRKLAWGFFAADMLCFVLAVWLAWLTRHLTSSTGWSGGESFA